MCAIRQWPNAAKLVTLWFCMKNHIKMAKICIFGPEKVIYDPSNHTDCLKTLYWHFLYVHRDLERKKCNLQKIQKNIFIFLGGFGPFLVTLNHSALLAKCRLTSHTDPYKTV